MNTRKPGRSAAHLPIELPRPENARDLELGTLRAERDAALADAAVARADLYRVLCALRLEVITIEGMRRLYAARKPLAVAPPTAPEGTQS